MPAPAPGPPVPPTVLVAVATAQDLTWAVGRAIAEALTQRGSDVDLTRLEAAHDADLDPGAYDAVVLGSDVHAGHWLTAARLFVAEHTAALNTRPVWVFSNPSIAAPSERTRPGVRIYGVVIATNPVDHRILPADDDFATTEAISAWADEITEAATLSAGSTTSSVLGTRA